MVGPDNIGRKTVYLVINVFSIVVAAYLSGVCSTDQCRINKNVEITVAPSPPTICN